MPLAPPDDEKLAAAETFRIAMREAASRHSRKVTFGEAQWRFRWARTAFVEEQAEAARQLMAVLEGDPRHLKLPELPAPKSRASNA